MELNFVQLSQELGIGTETYLRILRKAVAQTQQDLIEIEDALTKHDTEKIQAISHRLKGDYANLRLRHICGIAKEINDLCKGDPDFNLLGLLWRDFSKALKELEESMNTQH